MKSRIGTLAILCVLVGLKIGGATTLSGWQIAGWGAFIWVLESSIAWTVSKLDADKIGTAIYKSRLERQIKRNEKKAQKILEQAKIDSDASKN